jgi:hypothetical protein
MRPASHVPKSWMWCAQIYEQKIPKDRGQRCFGNVDDGIERGNPCKCSIRKVQGHHVSFPKGNVWAESSCLLQHSRRKIQAENGCAGIAQVSGDLTGPTAHITYLASSPDFSGKALETKIFSASGRGGASS